MLTHQLSVVTSLYISVLLLVSLRFCGVLRLTLRIKVLSHCLNLMESTC